MMNKKKLIAVSLGAVFALSALGSAFAAETGTQPSSSVQAEKHCDGGHDGKRGRNLEELAKQKGVTVEELKLQRKQEREAKWAERAAEKGITVDQLKAQMVGQHKAKSQEKLEKRAAEKGITVDQLKAQMIEQRQAKLEALAKQKGMTVEEWKTQFKHKGFRVHGEK